MNVEAPGLKAPAVVFIVEAGGGALDGVNAGADAFGVNALAVTFGYQDAATFMVGL